MHFLLGWLLNAATCNEWRRFLHFTLSTSIREDAVGCSSPLVYHPIIIISTRRQAGGRPCMCREKNWMHQQECTKDSDWISQIKMESLLMQQQRERNGNAFDPFLQNVRRCIPILLFSFFILVPFLLPWCVGCSLIQLAVKNRHSLSACSGW